MRLATESILLERDCSSNIAIDLLLQNSGPAPVHHFNVVYPRALTRWPRPQLSFEDATESFRDENGIANRFFRNPAYHRTFRSTENGLEMTFSIAEPDPKGSPQLATKEYTGLIAGGCQIAPVKLAEDDDHDSILQDILSHPKVDASILTCTLHEPIDVGEARWLRWSVGAVGVTTNPRSRGRRFGALLVGQLTHEYTITGPVNVMDALLLKLHDLLTAPGQELATSEVSLLVRFLKRQLKDSSTEIDDWWLRLVPGFSEKITVDELQGNLTQLTAVPIEFPVGRDLNERRCYHARAGAKYAATGGSAPGDVPGRFSLKFRVRDLALTLQVALVVIAVLGTLFGLVALFK